MRLDLRALWCRRVVASASRADVRGPLGWDLEDYWTVRFTRQVRGRARQRAVRRMLACVERPIPKNLGHSFAQEQTGKCFDVLSCAFARRFWRAARDRMGSPHHLARAMKVKHANDPAPCHFQLL